MEERNVFINKKEIDELFEEEKYRNCMEKKYFEYIVSMGKIEYIDKYLSYSKKKEEIRNSMDRKKVLMVIDKLFIKTDNQKDIGELEGSGIYNIEVSKEIIGKYGNKFISDGVFCLIKLEENIDTKYPYYIEEIEVLEDINVDLNEYRNYFSEGVKKDREKINGSIFSDNDEVQDFDSISNIDLVLNTVGISTKELTFWEKILFLVRLIPLCESNYNLMELGGNGIGKTKTYSMFSPECEIVQEMTAAGLIYNIQTKTFGSLATKDVIVFDEVNKIKLDGDKEKIIPQLLNFMADGQTTSPRKVISKTSLVFSGNVTGIEERIEKNEKNIFDNPHKFEDNAFLDRIHFFLPAWGLRRYSRNIHGLTIQNKVFRFDYFSKALSLLRNEDYSKIIDEKGYTLSNGSEREIKAIRKTVSGLIKLTHPDKQIDNYTLGAYIAIAIKGRGLVNRFLNNKNKNNIGKINIEVIDRFENKIQVNKMLKKLIDNSHLEEILKYFASYRANLNVENGVSYKDSFTLGNYLNDVLQFKRQIIDNITFYSGKFYPNRHIIVLNNNANFGEIVFIKFALDKIGIQKNEREKKLIERKKSSEVSLENNGRILIFKRTVNFNFLNEYKNSLNNIEIKHLYDDIDFNYDNLFGEDTLDLNKSTSGNIETRYSEVDFSNFYVIKEGRKLKLEDGNYVIPQFKYSKSLDKYFYEYGGDEKEFNDKNSFGMNILVEEKSKEPKKVSEMMTYVEFKYFLADNGFIELN